MLKQLLRQLNSRDAEVQREAIRKARLLSSEDLAQLVKMETSTYNRHVAWLFLSPALGLILLYFGMIASVILHFIAGLGVGVLFLLLSTLFVSFVGLPIWLGFTLPKRARRNLAAVFAEVDDPAFIQTLLTLLASGRKDKRITEHVARALKHLLPHLRDDQRHLLNYYHRQTLCSLLETHAADPELILTVLKALEQIGNDEALPAVEKFALQISPLQNEALQSATQECLLFLRQKYVQTQQAQTLLRASEAATSGVLLRPAMSDLSARHAEHLLRPVEADADCNITISEGTDRNKTVPVETEEVQILRGSG